MNLLPIAKKVQLQDSSCVLCGVAEDNAIHLFKNCSFASGVWLQSLLRLGARDHPSTPILEWMQDLMSTLPKDLFEVFLVFTLGQFGARETTCSGRGDEQTHVLFLNGLWCFWRLTKQLNRCLGRSQDVKQFSGVTHIVEVSRSM